MARSARNIISKYRQQRRDHDSSKSTKKTRLSLMQEQLSMGLAIEQLCALSGMKVEELKVALDDINNLDKYI